MLFPLLEIPPNFCPSKFYLTLNSAIRQDGENIFTYFLLNRFIKHKDFHKLVIKEINTLGI